MSFQLSICIPTYNRKRNLSELLDVLAEIRGMADIEVIVSDNASTDGTKEYMEDLVKKKKFKICVIIGMTRTLARIIILLCVISLREEIMYGC